MVNKLAIRQISNLYMLFLKPRTMIKKGKYNYILLLKFEYFSLSLV